MDASERETCGEHSNRYSVARILRKLGAVGQAKLSKAADGISAGPDKPPRNFVFALAEFTLNYSDVAPPPPGCGCVSHDT